MRRTFELVTLHVIALCASGVATSGFAQEEPPAVVEGTQVQIIQMPQAGPKDASGTPVPPGSALPPGVVPEGGPQVTKPSAHREKDGEKGAEEIEKGTQTSPQRTTPGAEAKPPATIHRTDVPPKSVDPQELMVRAGPDGVVHFQFRGQKWPDILDWYAEIAGLSVDWQELPGDFLNISTQRGYRVEELGDLLNRLLLARGFTMLPQGEFINVVRCDALDVSLVPRVRPEELDRLGAYDFVRVMFELDGVLASETIAELDPLLSGNGKLFALQTTNRVEAMDAVANLREIYRLLKEEQFADGGEPRLVQEFVLQYARAEAVQEALTQFLGTKTGAVPAMTGLSPEQLAQQQQQMMQMQMQQMAAQQNAAAQLAASQGAQPGGRSPRGRGSGPGLPTREEPVRLMVNPRRNSLLVQAPPDKMATIAQAIKLIDVPEQGAASLQAFLGRMQVYRLAQLDPQKLVESLQQLGGLDPSTRLEVDPVNRAIIAYASAADHHTIRMTVEKLDGSARRVEVIPLRRLAADEVAGTIQYLMAGTGDQRSSRRDYYDYGYGYGYSSRRGQTDKDTSDEFRVDADLVNNRLLVRANDMELEEVVSILVKLGEVPQLGRQGDVTRVLDITPGDDVESFLQRLQEGFKALAPNPLVIPELPQRADPPTAPVTPPAVDDAVPADTPKAKTVSRPSGFYQTAVFQQPSDTGTESDDGWASGPQAPTLPTPGAAAGAAPPAPIVVSIGPDGRLVLASHDAQALDLLEQLAARIAPLVKDYHVFRLENALASWVVLNLEDFFEDKEETERQRRDRMSWMWGMSSRTDGRDQRRLSQRKPLKFISDLDTNTILVQGADAQQLLVIADLIKLYDVPEPVSSQKARVTKLFTVKYSRASIIADTIKDAYRDLLSSNDPALQNGGKEQAKQPRGGGMTVISAFGFGEDTSTPADSRTSARFDGKLSIGVDDLSNTMLVSTEGENLMSMVEGMIQALDEAARPVSEVRVVRLSSHMDGSRLQTALEKVLRAQTQPGQQVLPGSPAAATPQPPAGNNAQRNRSRSAPGVASPVDGN